MARYKEYSYEQTKLIPVSYDLQILPGTFEYTLSEVIDSIDLTLFDNRYHNDATGASAYDPRILLKIVLFAYSKGVIYSRRIAQLCHDNVIFMALSADTHPHFTTIADFISSMQDEITGIFRHVLQICMELNLIDGSMFAIDGVKMPSNASKEWSGTKEDLKKKKEKLEQALKSMIRQHRQSDTREHEDKDDRKRFRERIERAKKKIRKLDEWLENNDDKVSSRNRTKQSNITDNESAKMKSSHGVIQGYNGIAMVDEKHQVIVSAEAFGQGNDTNLLAPAVEATKDNLKSIGRKDDCLKGSVVTADTGFHSAESLKFLEEEEIDGYVPDSNFRKRDPRFSTAGRYKREGKGSDWEKEHFDHSDFNYVKKGDYFLCPEGKRLEHLKGVFVSGTVTYAQYVSKQRQCNECPARSQCLTGANQKVRRVFLRSDRGEIYCEKMMRKIDTENGRRIYSQRMKIVEPVFGNIRWAKGLSRFTLRSKRKVNVQWLLYCTVHNIEKILHYGYPAVA